MKKYLLYITDLNFDSTIQGDIPCYSFESKEALLGYILSEISDDVVFMGLVNEDKFQISDDIGVVMQLISWYCDIINEDIVVHFTEHNSYEDAFELALDYMEISPLCYKKELNT